MKNFKKTFKIAEYAVGGTIRVTCIKKALLHVEALDYTTNEVLEKKSFIVTDYEVKNQIMNWLMTLTSYYYAEKVMTFLEGKIKFLP